MSDPTFAGLPEAALRLLANDNRRMRRLEDDWRRASDGDLEEITAESRATLGDLWNCYRLLLNRAPDPIGTPFHLGSVREGISVRDLVRRFLESAEHAVRYEPPAETRPTLMSVNDVALHLPVPRTTVDLDVRATGRHKPHRLGAISSVLKVGMCVLDVGAGAGEFAIPAACKVGPTGRIIALEPHPEALRALLANILAHALGNVAALPFCAADGDGFVTLITEHGIASARDVTQEDLTGPTPVPVVYARTLDSLLQAERRVDVLMMALDGFDYRALQGGSDILARCRPHLFGEYAPDLLARYSQIDPRDYLRRLQRHGYNRFVAIPRDRPPILCDANIDTLASLPERLGTDAVDFYAQAT